MMLQEINLSMSYTRGGVDGKHSGFVKESCKWFSGAREGSILATREVSRGVGSGKSCRTYGVWGFGWRWSHGLRHGLASFAPPALDRIERQSETPRAQSE